MFLSMPRPAMLRAMSEHYFSTQPTAPGRERELRTTLAGAERRLRTDSGIFSPDGLDKGTAVLLDLVPAPPEHGALLDIGCGWGPIALSLALRSPQAQVYAVDVNQRSLDLTRKNAELLGLGNISVSVPEDLDPAITFQTFWSNPPIRVGKSALHEIMRLWLPRLAPGGTAYLVVQKNLGSDSLQRWLAEEFPHYRIRRFGSVKAFRVLEVHAPQH